MQTLRPFICLCFFISVVEAALLDKIAVVVDDSVFSLSEIKRVQKTYDERKNFAPLLFQQKNPGLRQLAEKMGELTIIRLALKKQGITISDDAVESRLKDLQRQLGYQKTELMQYLESRGFTYAEYFELTRRTIEFSTFNSRIIRPLISISEQEKKNFFFKNHPKASTFAFQYELVDYNIDKNQLPKEVLQRLPALVQDYRDTQIRPELLSSMKVFDIDQIGEESLAPPIVKGLKTTPQGALSSVVDYDGRYHVFFIKKKNLQDSSLYLREKQSIEAKLYEQKAQGLIASWLEKEKLTHFYRILLDPSPT